MQIEGIGKSDVGCKRAKNEDNHLVLNDLKLYVVADGMGGHVGGEFASKLAVHTIEETMKNLTQDPEATLEQLGEHIRQGDYKAYLSYAIRMASRKIFEKSVADEELQGMGTTAIVLLLRGKKIYLANVGDSRGYRIRDKKIEQLTTDHSLVEEQVRAGMLRREEASKHRLKNVITRSVGFQDDVEVDTQSKMAQENDIYLLCSDGLYNMIEAEEILDIVNHHNLQEATNHLIDIANSRGGDDNITVILVKINSLKGAEGEDDEETEIQS